MPGGAQQHKALLQRLGKHKTGAGCLYLNRLDDANPLVLRELLETSVAWLRDYLAATSFQSC